MDAQQRPSQIDNSRVEQQYLRMKLNEEQLRQQLISRQQSTSHQFDISYAIHMHPMTHLKSPDFLDHAKNSFFEIMCEILYAALPLILCFTLNCLPHLINLFLIGHHSDPEMMSAIGLGTILGNIFGFLIIENISMGFAALCSYFEDDKQEVGFMYQKTLGINFFICILITPLLYLSDRVLLAAGFHQLIVQYSSEYVWALVPSFYLYSFYETTKNYLQSQQLVYPSLIVSSIGCILHYFIAQFFILNLGYPVTGAAWAFNLSSGFNCLVLYLYILKTEHTQPSWIEWNICATNNIHKFLLQILTHKVFTYFEALQLQILCIAACGLPQPTSISAHFALTYSFFTFYFMIVGISHCLNRTISLSIEDNSIRIAKRKVILGNSLMLALAVIIVANIMAQKQHFLYIFHDDSRTAEAMQSIFVVFLCILLVESQQISFFGIFKTLQANSISRIYVISYYLIGLGCAIILGYGCKLQLLGIWLGWLLGAFCCLCLQIRLMAKLDWQAAFDLIREKHKTIQEDIRTSRMELSSVKQPI